MAFIFVEHLILCLKVTQIPAGDLTLMTKGLRRAIVFFLEEIQSPRALGSSKLYPVLQQKLNIEVWRMLLQR